MYIYKRKTSMSRCIMWTGYTLSIFTPTPWSSNKKKEVSADILLYTMYSIYSILYRIRRASPFSCFMARSDDSNGRSERRGHYLCHVRFFQLFFFFQFSLSGEGFFGRLQVLSDVHKQQHNILPWGMIRSKKKKKKFPCIIVILLLLTVDNR